MIFNNFKIYFLKHKLLLMFLLLFIIFSLFFIVVQYIIHKNTLNEINKIKSYVEKSFINDIKKVPTIKNTQNYLITLEQKNNILLSEFTKNLKTEFKTNDFNFNFKHKIISFLSNHSEIKNECYSNDFLNFKKDENGFFDLKYYQKDYYRIKNLKSFSNINSCILFEENKYDNYLKMKFSLIKDSAIIGYFIISFSKKDNNNSIYLLYNYSDTKHSFIYTYDNNTMMIMFKDLEHMYLETPTKIVLGLKNNSIKKNNKDFNYHFSLYKHEEFFTETIENNKNYLITFLKIPLLEYNNNNNNLIILNKENLSLNTIETLKNYFSKQKITNDDLENSEKE